MGSKPILQAFILADQIYREVGGKHIICGTFNQANCLTFPDSLQAPVYAYLAVRSLNGNYGLVLRYVDLSTNEVMMESQKISLSSSDPLKTLEIVVGLPPLFFPHAGQFAIDVFIDDDRIASYRVLAHLVTGNQ